MALKVKAVERKIKFNKNDEGVWRYVMQPELYIALTQAKVIKEAALRSGCSQGEMRACFLILIVLGIGGSEAADDDLSLVAIADMLCEHTPGDAGRLGLGKAVDTGADTGEGDALQAVFLSQSHGCVVTRSQQFTLMLIATVPNGPDGMDDFLTGQQIGIGHLALPSLTTAQCAALLQQSFTCSPMDGAIYTATAQQTPVGGIHDRIDLQRRDIPYYNLDSFFHIPSD